MCFIFGKDRELLNVKHSSDKTHGSMIIAMGLVCLGKDEEKAEWSFSPYISLTT